MKVTVKITRSFKTAAKPLLKKYQALSKELLKLGKGLLRSTRLRTPQDKDTYKILLKIASKGKRKSGGARVISIVETTLIGYTEIASDEEITVNLITIYDKEDVDNISDQELKNLIQNFKTD